MLMIELAVHFNCQDSTLIGILHQAARPSNVGVIMVVAGGPQYRVGVSRQFVLMARYLASRNIPTLRFDHRGTGDSEGAYQGFIDMNDDIKSAVEELVSQHPTVEKVVLWGECESASGIAFYAHTDPSICGIFMVNPWIRTEEGQAQTYIRHYYISRVLNRDFWKKVLMGKYAISESASSFIGHLRKAKRWGRGRRGNIDQISSNSLADLTLPQRLEQSSALFNGEIFILTSGNDLIAKEFVTYFKLSPLWQDIGKQDRFNMKEVSGADHSFSRTDWRDQLFKEFENWIQEKIA